MAEIPGDSGALAPAVPWLAAWIGRQLATGSAQRAELSGVEGEAIYLSGWMGTETALTSEGEVWIGEYELEGFHTAMQSIRWRRAEGVERVGFIVIGARRFAALRALLPARPSEAPRCASCRATGDWHVFSSDGKESLRIRGMICKVCGGLGWRAGAA